MAVNLIQRLFNITKDFESVPKNGWNDYSKYHYVMANEIIECTRKLMVKHGVFNSVDYELISRTLEGKNFHTVIRLKVRFFNVDNKEDAYYVEGIGISADTLDKDLYKAITNGLKYIYISQFKIPVDLQDAENDELEKKNVIKNEVKQTSSTTKGPW